LGISQVGTLDFDFVSIFEIRISDLKGISPRVNPPGYLGDYPGVYPRTHSPARSLSHPQKAVLSAKLLVDRVRNYNIPKMEFGKTNKLHRIEISKIKEQIISLKV